PDLSLDHALRDRIGQFFSPVSAVGFWPRARRPPDLSLDHALRDRIGQFFYAGENCSILQHFGERSEEHTSELQSRSELVYPLMFLPPQPTRLFPYTTLFRSPDLSLDHALRDRIGQFFSPVSAVGFWPRARRPPDLSLDHALRDRIGQFFYAGENCSILQHFGE